MNLAFYMQLNLPKMHSMGLLRPVDLVRMKLRCLIINIRIAYVFVNIIFYFLRDA